MIDNLVVVSDLHAGCQFGLCPPNGVHLDGGGRYTPNTIQERVYGYWRHFWDKWVPHITEGQPYAVCVNGDSLDGIHHNSVHQISHNLAMQREYARSLLCELAERCRDMGTPFWVVRGTEAHVGQSGQDEEELARDLGARENEFGQHARHELWVYVGPWLGHVMHHVGTTGSQHYETTGVHKELTESFTEAARWGEQPPDFIVRSHRHRMIRTELPTRNGNAFSVVTPGWQAKTPFTYRVAGGRITQPQFGGICIRNGEEGPYLRQDRKSVV